MFFLMIQPAPRSTLPHTLFPFTTLFRSPQGTASQTGSDRGGGRPVKTAPSPRTVSPGEVEARPSEVEVDAVQGSHCARTSPSSSLGDTGFSGHRPLPTAPQICHWPAHAQPRRHLDRTSTRLNSSH